MGNSSQEGLRAFAESGDEAAFGRVVEAFGGLVYGSALRRTGERGMAEEVAQSVFAIAARKAGRLASHPQLEGWFYATTRYVAAKAVRGRARYEKRIRVLAEETRNGTTPMTDEENEVWREAVPVLDECIDRLSEGEQGVLLGRYFEELSFEEIAERSGASVGACKMRLKRTLEKLNRWLSGRGVKVSAGVLASGLAMEFSKGVPAGVGAALGTKAIGAASGVGLVSILTNTLHTMNAAKTGWLAAAGVLLVLAVPIGVQRSVLASLEVGVASPGGRAAVEGFSAGAGAVAVRKGGAMGRFLKELRATPSVEQLLEGAAMHSFLHDIGEFRRVDFALAAASGETRQRLREELGRRPTDEANMLLQRMSHYLAEDIGPREAMDMRLEASTDVRLLKEDLGRWVKAEPDAALAWFDERRAEGALLAKGSGKVDVREKALSAALFVGLVATDAERAFERLEGLDAETRAEAIGSAAVRTLFDEEAGTAVALGWIGRLESAEERAEAAWRGAETLVAFEGLDAAVEFVRGIDLEDEGVASAMAAIAWKEKEFGWEEKIDWAMGHTPDGGMEMLVEELVGMGQFWEPEGFKEWMAALPEGALRDVALSASARTLAAEWEEEEAMERSKGIGDEALRGEVMREILGELAKEEREEAEALAEKYGVKLEGGL